MRAHRYAQRPAPAKGESKWALDEPAGYQAAEAPAPAYRPRKPTGMTRAKVWSARVEESWRLQQVGWRELEEYRGKYGDPERWPNGFLKVLRTKKDGFWTYWRDHRECENKYLRQVKIFRYD